MLIVQCVSTLQVTLDGDSLLDNNNIKICIVLTIVLSFDHQMTKKCFFLKSFCET